MNLGWRRGTGGINSPDRIGLTAYGPNINNQRDPRFGRSSELPGEDPLLSGTYASEMVQGMQEEDGQGYPKVIAYLKHFTACKSLLSLLPLPLSPLPPPRHTQYLLAPSSGDASIFDFPPIFTRSRNRESEPIELSWPGIYPDQSHKFAPEIGTLLLTSISPLNFCPFRLHLYT